jgi:recombination protein RecT
MKKQCDFIIYGNKLTLQREYHGTIALARRFSEMKDVYAQIIYEGDVFEYSIDKSTGRKSVIKHEQDFKNINNDKIKGAYAIVVFNDGSTNLEIMTMAQIRKAWEQGPMKGASPAHKNFPDEMSKKTVINRACKLLISGSDDSILREEDDDTNLIKSVKEEIVENANMEEISMDDKEPQTAQPVTEETPSPESSKEEPKTAPKKGNGVQGTLSPDF